MLHIIVAFQLLFSLIVQIFLRSEESPRGLCSCLDAVKNASSDPTQNVIEFIFIPPLLSRRPHRYLLCINAWLIPMPGEAGGVSQDLFRLRAPGTEQ